MKRSILCIIILLTVTGCAPTATPWKSLFNGKDLTGWKILNGPAKFYVEDGVIAGVTADGPDNTFLCTTEDYGDFILEFEIKIDEGLNSGVQIRSLSKPDYRNGKVHGYQVECDSSDRRWSGSILDEQRRGWLYCVERNSNARKAFEQGQWNKFRAEAYGNQTRTFVNGIECADVIDDMTPRGFIGLQIHRIKDKNLIGRKVRWRNIRILTSDVKKHLTEVNYSVPQVNVIPNTISAKEKKLGWKLLWDGKTTKGWRGAKSATFPDKGWKIENDALVNETSGGDIVTVDKFENFELEVHFKYTEGCNSGIKYFINPEDYNGKGATIGCEYQILDDKYFADANNPSDPDRSLASVFDLIAPENEQGKKAKRDLWNRARIIVKGNHVEHWLLNMKMLEYERNTQTWRALVANSKYRNLPNFGTARQGHILLQDHGHKISFRSIKIRKLD